MPLTQTKIKVMIVDDSIFFREFMLRSLSTIPSIEVVGVAGDAFEALEKVPALRPDVITLDMEMPKMRGVDFLKQLKPRYPNIRVIVISALSGNVFQALEAGAVDFVSKPNTRPGYDNNAFISEITGKISIAAQSSTTKRAPAPAVAAPKPAFSSPLSQMYSFPNPKSVIAIGASTGGTEAIIAVIKNFPANCPGGVIVQHMPPVFTRMYAERVDKICKMNVREAQHGDRVEAGVILIAPGGDQHMRLKSDARGYFVTLQPGEKISGHCPSIDALFESVAETAGPNAVGVILTGMGADGAKNLLTMKKRGAYTVGQDQASCVVYGMPMVAYNLGGVVDQLPLDAISDAVLRKLSKK